jgi:hypothetical protein
MLSNKKQERLQELTTLYENALSQEEADAILKEIVSVATAPSIPEDDEEWAQYLGLSLGQWLGQERFSPILNPSLPCGADDAAMDRIDAIKEMIALRKESSNYSAFAVALKEATQ